MIHGALALGMMLSAMTPRAGITEKLDPNFVRFDCTYTLRIRNPSTGENQTWHYLNGFIRKRSHLKFLYYVGGPPTVYGNVFNNNSPTSGPIDGEWRITSNPFGLTGLRFDITLNTKTGALGMDGSYVLRMSGTVPVMNRITIAGTCRRNLEDNDLPDVDIDTGAILSK